MNLIKYIGRPYQEYNCFDLVKEFYLDHYGLDLRNYFDDKNIPDRATVECLISTNKGDFLLVDGEPEFGDLIVIKLFGYSCHIGVYIGEGSFIHSIRGPGSCIEPTKKYLKITEGYYRHKERAS